jgi:multidrug transporter EmrE-like cation transporter
MKNLVFALVSIVMGAAGQILLKVGTNHIGAFDMNLAGLLAVFKSGYIWTGLILFASSFLLWIKVLSVNELSYVYPMVSISYIVVVLASRFLFNEPFSASKLIGLTAIILGVFMINR